MARADLLSLDIQTNAVEGGSPDAHYQLGLLYCLGREVEHDLVTAHKWFNIAAMRGNRAAREYRAEIASEMSKQQIAKAQKLAREWIARH